MDTRQLPGMTTPMTLKGKTDDEIITQGLNSDDYMTRRLAILADRFQRLEQRARIELEALKDWAEHAELAEPEQAGA